MQISIPSDLGKLPAVLNRDVYALSHLLCNLHAMGHILAAVTFQDDFALDRQWLSPLSCPGRKRRTLVATSELFAAMAAAFPEIEGAIKDSANDAFKRNGRASKYADLTSVVLAIKPALVKHKLFFIQLTHEQQGGVCIETVVCHEGGEQLSFGKLFVPAGKNDAQGYGSALTYARRYSLMTAFGVCPEDDDGNAAAAAARATSVQPEQSASNPVREEGDGGYIGPKGGKMKLKARADALYRDILGCGDRDMLEALLNSGETQDLKTELEQYWFGYLSGEGMTPDFEAIYPLVQRMRQELPYPDDMDRDVQNPLGAG